MSRSEGFLGRWSRLKSEARVPPADGPADAPTTPPEPAAEPDPPPPEVEEAEPLDLPDVETLDAGSDYTAFLDPRVPEETHRQALRKLWASDPAHGFRDGLDDYDGDYTTASLVGSAVKTVYDVVRGYAPAPEEPEELEKDPVVAGDDGADGQDDAGAEETPTDDAETSESIHVAQDAGDTPPRCG